MSIVDPSVLELLNHAESRYTLVVEASKRGREIVNGALPMIDADGMKPLKIAVVFVPVAAHQQSIDIGSGQIANAGDCEGAVLIPLIEFSM